MELPTFVAPMSSIESSRRAALIKAEAQHLGFESCGISKAEFLQDEAARFERWLHNGMQGRMQYMERNVEKRLDPRLLVDGAKSVISLAMNYYPPERQNEKAPRISRYAYGKDYHFVIKDKLKLLLHILNEKIGAINGRAFVDSAPVMERAWAARSGIGWVGKNSMLILPHKGSYFFLAELIVDLELEADLPVKDYCGTCTRCMDACPTEAITEQRVVDGSRCISYFTIELKDEIPDEMSGKFGDWMFGCDVCQEVCPWNRFAQPHREKELVPNPDLLTMTWKDWEEVTEDVFAKSFLDSPLQRPGFKNMKRNLRFITSWKRS